MYVQVPDDGFLRRIGLVVFLVADLEGLLIYDLVRFRSVLPSSLDVLSSMSRTIEPLTTSKLGEYFVSHSEHITDAEVATYYRTGGRALTEIGPRRNAVLHARPGVDGNDPDERLRLIRSRPHSDAAKHEVFMVDDNHLDQLIVRIGELRRELLAVRPDPAR